MPVSQNGYSANDRSVIASYTVPGTSLRISLRKGDCSVVLLDYLARYNREVEPLSHNPQDLWGYAERTIRGSSTTLSNHASGTATDTRATRHGLGMTGTFTAPEEAHLNSLLASYGGVLRHGKDYSGRKDPMHAEVVGSPAAVKAVADRIRSGAPASTARITDAPTLQGDDPVQCFEWPAGTSTHKIVCPVGSASGLVSRGWFSLACDGEITELDVWFQGDAAGITEFRGLTVAKDRRQLWAMPDGTSQIVVHLKATGPVGAAVELQPK